MGALCVEGTIAYTYGSALVNKAHEEFSAGALGWFPRSVQIGATRIRVRSISNRPEFPVLCHTLLRE